MKISKRIMLTIAIAFVTGAKSATLEDHDPYIWLSDIHGARATAWVAAENARSNAALTIDPRYAVFREEILKSLDTEDRIPLVNVDHGSVYNFWQDAAHVRGLWRRAGVTEYRNANPNWEILLDVDKYDAEQHKNWVFHGAQCAPQDFGIVLPGSTNGIGTTTARAAPPGVATSSFVPSAACATGTMAKPMFSFNRGE